MKEKEYVITKRQLERALNYNSIDAKANIPDYELSSMILETIESNPIEDIIYLLRCGSFRKAQLALEGFMVGDHL